MKRFVSILFSLILVVVITGCSGSDGKKKIEGNMKTYYEMADGTYSCNDYTYKKRIELTGRIPNAEEDAKFVYLSNLDEITFEQAWKQILSSDSKDYFSPEDAVLVEWE